MLFALAFLMGSVFGVLAMLIPEIVRHERDKHAVEEGSQWLRTLDEYMDRADANQRTL